MPRVSPVGAIQMALYTKLNASSAFLTVATGGVFNGRAPAGKKGRYVVIAPTDETPADMFGAAGHTDGVQIDCWDVPTTGLAITNYLGVSDLYAAVATTLDPHDPGYAPLVVPGQEAGVIVSVSFVTAMMDDSVAPTAARIIAQATITTLNLRP